MKWILCFLLVSSCLLQAQEQDYIQIYNLISQADALKKNGQTNAAAEQYRDAQTALEKLQSAYPKWNETVVKFRLSYIAENLQTPATTRTETNPAQSDRGAKLQREIVSLQKERDLLKVSLNKENAALEQKILAENAGEKAIHGDAEKKPEPVSQSSETPTVEPVKQQESQPAAETKPKLKKEIPPGAGALVAQAEKAFAANNFDEAEKKYLEVLQQDEKNVYILGNLAATQMQMDHTADVEKNVRRALELDPEDAFSLTLLGMVKFRQEKFDEALDLLGRSAKLDPQNPETQNYLGITLSQKGRRAEAESALRKAIQLQPGYAGAHYNLALVYATQQPPFMELARWHYQKAIALGHPKNSQLEKTIAEK